MHSWLPVLGAALFAPEARVVAGPERPERPEALPEASGVRLDGELESLVGAEGPTALATRELESLVEAEGPTAPRRKPTAAQVAKRTPKAAKAIAKPRRKAVERLAGLLDGQAMTATAVPNDGSCLFHALALLLGKLDPNPLHEALGKLDISAARPPAEAAVMLRQLVAATLLALPLGAVLQPDRLPLDVLLSSDPDIVAEVSSGSRRKPKPTGPPPLPPWLEEAADRYGGRASWTTPEAIEAYALRRGYASKVLEQSAQKKYVHWGRASPELAVLASVLRVQIWTCVAASGRLEVRSIDGPDSDEVPKLHLLNVRGAHWDPIEPA